MPRLRMETGRQNVVDHSLVTDLMNGGQFCFSCEQIFANRKCLEEHMCPSASFICSCGTEFTEYKHMQAHSTTHEPGHQVLDHETIKKRRIEKRIEEEEKLKRLQKGEVVWNMPKVANLPSVSFQAEPLLQVPNKSVRVSQFPMLAAQISQVPELYPSMSQSSLLPNPLPQPTDMQNIFAGVGAPTVDLWTLYQPVVLVQTTRKFNKKKPYTCGKCGQCFASKPLLVSHHNSHVVDKISGCVGCGLLLSSKKVMPRFHACNASNSASKFKLVTARPLNKKTASETSGKQLSNQNRSAPRATSTLKNQKIKTYNNNQGLHINPTLLFKNQSQSASKLTIGVSLPSKSQTMQLKSPKILAGGALSKPNQIASASNGFTCRVCHIPFETAQLLQRHKCVKAREFMAQHVRGGRQQYKLKSITPMASPVPAQMNGERKFGGSPSRNVKKDQVMTVGLDKGQGMVPVNGNTGVDSDDDCYIVEGGPDKPAEMIYQVTSSVPIKT